MTHRTCRHLLGLAAPFLAIIYLPSCSIASGQSDSCAGWKPITLAGQSIDGLTDQDAQEILTHNLYGSERGCW